MSATISPKKYRADPSRLASGTLCHTRDRQIGEGDISASYSADKIGMEGKVRKPFAWQNVLWVCTGMHSHGDIRAAEGYRLVPERFFSGEPLEVVWYARTFHSHSRANIARLDLTIDSLNPTKKAEYDLMLARHLPAYFFACFCSTTASAATYTFDLTGTVETPSATSTASSGDSFELSIVFDDTDVVPVGADPFIFHNTGALAGSSLQINGQSFGFQGGLGSGGFSVIDNGPSGDAIGGSFALEVGSMLGTALAGFSFDLNGSSALTSAGLLDALGATDYDLSASSFSLLESDFFTVNFQGKIDSLSFSEVSLSAVPIPAAAFGYGTVIFLLAALGQMQRREKSET